MARVLERVSPVMGSRVARAVQPHQILNVQTIGDIFTIVAVYAGGVTG